MYVIYHSDLPLVCFDALSIDFKGYHQKCHQPIIESAVLLPEVPWECLYCCGKQNNPYVQKNPFEPKKSGKNKDKTAKVRPVIALR